MKPVRVSRALLTKMRQAMTTPEPRIMDDGGKAFWEARGVVPPATPVVANPDWDGVMRAQAREPKPNPRHPIGPIANALPELWLARQADNSLWLMAESSEGVTCLATISAATLEMLCKSRAPVELKP